MNTSCSSRVSAVSRALGRAGLVTLALLAVVLAGSASAASAASISGHVTDSEAPPQDLSNICVNAFGQFGSGFAQTDAGGQYTISDLPADTYKVQFSDCGAGNFASQYYDGKSSYTAADSVMLEASEARTGIDAALEQPGSISGVVRDATNDSLLPGICVTAYAGASQAYVGSGTTNSQGLYTLAGLPAGSYRLQFSDCSGAGYLQQYYDGKATLAGANPVSVTAGEETDGIDASLTPSARISGTVTEADDPEHGLSNICVSALPSGSGSGAFGQTDADGHYTLTGLPSGTYRIQFYDCYQGDHVGQYYDGKADPGSANLVDATEGETTPNIDAALVLAGRISGRVTDSEGDPVSVCVSAEPSDGSASGFHSAITGSDGRYTLTGLAPGSYRVAFGCGYFGGGSPYAAEYYDNKATAGTATPVPVAAGATTGDIDASLQQAGTISGHVTGPSGDPVFACATAYPGSASDGADVFDPVGETAYTDENGDYQITGLLPGSYKVRFSDCSGEGDFADQYFDGAIDLNNAQQVEVTEDEDTPNVDAMLDAGGYISGVVTDVNGAEVSGVCVTAEDSGGNVIGGALTFYGGSYTLSGLPVGSYRVHFFTAGCPFATRSFAGEYYDDAPDSASAASVPVAAHQLTDGIDATLASTGGAIAGRVTDETTSAGLPGQCVYLFAPNGGGPGSISAYATTDADGEYVVEGLLPGSYRVQFGGCGDDDYVVQFFDNRPDLASADQVNVTNGQTTDGVDAALVTAGRITGTVTDDSNPAQPLGNICVSAYPSNSGAGAAYATTAADGTYTLRGLPEGSFRVQFYDCAYFSNPEYVTQYYDGKPDLGSATPVAATPGETTAGIDAHLQRSGHITGTVTNEGASPQPLAGICVSVSAGGPGSATATDANGNYTITGLTTGSYVVRFEDCANGDYATEYWDDASDMQSADPVEVTVGEDTDGVDAQLARAGKIAGTVTDTATPPNSLTGICVTALAGGSGQARAFTQTAANGTYTLRGLLPGAYKVQFSSCQVGASYATQYYDGRSDLGSADEVTVSAAQTTPAIDAHMTRGGNISGTVADGSFNGLPNICVSASRVGGGTGGSATTNSNGAYSIQGLQAGSYKIHFERCPGNTGNWLPEYYDDEQDLASSDPVSVTVDQTTTGINAQLAEGGEVDGHVTDTAAHDLTGICVTAYHTDGASAGTAQTDSDGLYSIRGLEPGTYKVGFFDCTSFSFAAQFYDGKLDFPSADGVSVQSAAPTTGIDAELVEGGKISGTVTNSAPTPRGIAGICVSATGPQGAQATTDASGHYTIKGLATGSYKVQFFDCLGTVWNGQFYDGKATENAADPVGVTQGQTTSAIDAHLTPMDTAEPNTTLDSQPDSASSSPDATFTYHSSKPGSTFECKLDEGDFEECEAAGQTYHDLDESTHTFSVRAIDAVGNFDPTPATFTWTVDRTAPDTLLDDHPMNPSTSADATFTFHSEEGGVSFECRLGDGEFGDCPAGGQYHDLPDGSHTFSVRARDAAGNIDESPATFTWKIDTTAPTTTIDMRPDDPSKSADATFTYHSSEEGSTFECKLDDEELGPCPSSEPTYSNLAEESHTFTVHATDAAGNQGSGASYTWTVDLTPPDTSLDPDTGPAEGTTVESPNAALAFSSSEPGSTFECKLDNGEFDAESCSSPHTLSGLPSGDHTFSVRATDAAGNVDGSPAVRHWTVAPDTIVLSGPGNADGSSGAVTADPDAAFGFASTGSEATTFSCKLDEEAEFTECPTPHELDGLSAAEHSLSVVATDDGIPDPTPAVRVWTVDPSSGHQRTSGTTAGPDDVVTNDPLGHGTSPSRPIVTGVHPAQPGDSVTIDVSDATGDPPNGFTLFGKKIEITAPASDSTHPLRLVFTIDPSLIPAGVDKDNATVFRNGVPAPDCDDSGNASPGGLCIALRETLAGGGIRLTVLADHASTWNFGKANPSPPGDDGTNPGAGANPGPGTAPGTEPATPGGGSEQTPAGGETTSGNPSVRCVVPGKLKGKRIRKAKRRLKRAHCRLGKVKRKRSTKVRKGRVIRTRPGAGKERPEGAKVKLVVSKGRGHRRK